VLALLSTLLIGRTYAQFSLSGQVIDNSTSLPLSGAVVEIHELNRTTVTSSDGRYHFGNLRKTLYHLHITHVGFSSTSTSIRVNESQTTLNFALKPTTIELQEVLVESNHFKTGAKEHALAMEILDADYLRGRGKTSLANALEDLPGI